MKRDLLVVAVGVAAAGLVAASADLPARDAAELVALSLGVALVATVVGREALRRVQHPLVVALMTVASVGLGSVVAARAMFVSEHDLSALSVIVVGAGTAGVLGAFALAAELERARRHADDAAERERAIERSRRQLVAWVSHDLRTPLAGIRAMAEALDDGVVAEADDVHAYHARIIREADRLASLVDDLFELARLDAGAAQLELVAVPLGEVVSEAMAAASAVAGTKGVEVAGAPLDAPTVRASARELHRIVGNLLDNAIRHTPPGGKVTVEVTRADGHAELSVLDSCGGIPVDDLDQVFELAYRGDSARTPTQGQGSGLGLAIAKGFAEAHQGAIAVRNERDGCRFTVRLPLA